MTPRELIALATARLAEHGVPSPAHDARSLLRHVLGERPLELIDEVSDPDVDAYIALLARRALREPLQHILGEATFRYSQLVIARGAFVPRPETEIVAGAAIEWLAEREVPRVVDLCTGSGAIAAAIADEVPGAQTWAVELSKEAAAVAQQNLEPRGVMLVLGDAADALPELDGTIDAVISNPPYIPDGAIPRDPEVTEWDPPAALYGGGPDGEDIPRAVAARAAALLRDGGLFVMEHGDLQGESMRALVAATGAFEAIETGRDLTDRDRYVRAIRRRR